jgi:hypothetical protein
MELCSNRLDLRVFLTTCNNNAGDYENGSDTLTGHVKYLLLRDLIVWAKRIFDHAARDRQWLQKPEVFLVVGGILRLDLLHGKQISWRDHYFCVPFVLVDAGI